MAVQQEWRMRSNLPLIALSEDVAQQTQKNIPVSQAVGRTVDLSAEHVMFTVVYDKSGNETASSGQINGKTPELPRDVLNHVTPGKQAKFTWEPQKGYRFATVVTAVTSSGQVQGYVLAAQSLSEVESQINNLMIIIGLSWLASMVILFLTYFMTRPTKSR